MVLDALHAAGEQLGVGVGLMLAADRTVEPSVAVEQARLAATVRRPRAWCRSASPTTRPIGPPEPFAEAFAIAKEAGLLLDAARGRAGGPRVGAGRARRRSQPDRIQHGVRSIEDPELVKRLADSDIVLDVCPTSNLLLSVYPSLAEHPLPQLLDGGDPVQPQRRRPAAVRAGAARRVRAGAHRAGARRRRARHRWPGRRLGRRARPTSSRRRRWTRSTTGSRRFVPGVLRLLADATNCPVRPRPRPRQRPAAATRSSRVSTQHAAEHRDAERARRLDQRLVDARRRAGALGRADDMISSTDDTAAMPMPIPISVPRQRPRPAGSRPRPRRRRRSAPARGDREAEARDAGRGPTAPPSRIQQRERAPRRPRWARSRGRSRAALCPCGPWIHWVRTNCVPITPKNSADIAAAPHRRRGSRRVWPSISGLERAVLALPERDEEHDPRGRRAEHQRRRPSALGTLDDGEDDGAQRAPPQDRAPPVDLRRRGIVRARDPTRHEDDRHDHDGHVHEEDRSPPEVREQEAPDRPDRPRS